ncbi:hypothetical protein [Nocardia asteroides]|uniref:hypothetical protein n=1 Tax=Nocardia asteroides TaxID=1824 RepID=UPI001E2C4DFE|nr:hypothetical protein [Nocardia asteroides]UGT61808.1 hypothetical protein LTT61_00160 [Nocardia asteroides]
MARVVCVHGIGQQVSGSEVLLEGWRPALNSGLVLAGADKLGEGEVAAGFHGDLFRPPGQPLSGPEPWYDADDVEPGLEQDLLAAWWHAAAATDPAVQIPDDQSLGRVPMSVQRRLEALADSRFFAGIALRSMVGSLKQVRRYLTEPPLRDRIRARVRDQITGDTRVVVAHSLGSVVAYETLCAMPGHPVRALITLGSPLGIANLIFHRLDPSPTGGVGAWPGRDGLVWSNFADAGDVVALVKQLDPLFGATFSHRVWDTPVHNGSHAHSAVPYLTEKRVGEAIAAGLRGE